MKNVPKLFTGLTCVELPESPVHLAIGIFDGLHRGHRAVLQSALEEAEITRGLAGVLTFWPHPSVYFGRPDPVRLIMGRKEKEQMLFDWGFSFIIEQPFDEAFSRVEAEAFPQMLKECIPALDTVYVGENWHFGRDRKGTVTRLVQWAREAGFSVCSLERMRLDGEAVSSTRIRDCLTEGRIWEANLMLGHPYSTKGVVVAGRQLGRTLGFPTLNLPWAPELQPRHGVYVVAVRGVGDRDQEKWHPAVANYGLRPTVGSSAEPLLEVHLLSDATTFSTGDALEVRWFEFLRGEMRFNDLDELKNRISKDCEQAMAFWSKHRGLL